MLNNGAGSFGQPQYFPLAAPPQSLALPDLDGDGYPDLAVGTAAQFLGPESPPKIHFTDPRLYVAQNIPDTAPVAACKNITVDTGSNDCSEPVTAQQVNDGSHDDDFGDTIKLSLSPAGPYNVGATMVTLTVTDNHGLASSCTATITVQDKTKPVVTLNGLANVTVECHTSFTDPGATATDNCTPDLMATPSGSVDVNTPGSYVLTYSATDASTNTGTATRTVVVVDSTPPDLVLNGAAQMEVECHDSFADPGATASDTCKGNLTAAIVVTGNVDVNTPGLYLLTYKVSDGPNTTTKSWSAVVQDTLHPW